MLEAGYAELKSRYTSLQILYEATLDTTLKSLALTQFSRPQF